MKIAIVGGTGKEGRGMAVRWVRASHDVWIGSRDAERARSTAAELSQLAGHPIAGGDNESVVQQADVVVLAVPYAAHRETLLGLKPALRGRILVDITVPLKPPDVRRVSPPEGKQPRSRPRPCSAWTRKWSPRFTTSAQPSWPTSNI